MGAQNFNFVHKCFQNGGLSAPMFFLFWELFSNEKKIADKLKFRGEQLPLATPLPPRRW